MAKEKPALKKCRHCNWEMPYDANICPNCRKKQKKGCFPIVIGIIVIFIVLALFSGDDEPLDDKPTTKIENNEEEKKNETSFSYEDMDVKFVKSKIEKNFADEKCLVLYFDFYNNTKENQAFYTNFSVKAFQEGVEIDSSMWEVNEETENDMKEVQPGKSVRVAVAFVLGESEEVVNIEIEPWITLSDDKLLEFDVELE